MLSYQHGFHAGNKADLLKHAVLDAILRREATLPRAHFYVETHAGRGIYDLTGKQAQKTGEAEAGVLSLMTGQVPKPLRDWITDVRAAGPKAYKGSPAIASQHLKQRDRAILFERHPAEYKALISSLGNDNRFRIQKADGYNAALKLAPRRGERMTIVVDPSYETLRDMDELAVWVPRALTRWPDATIILWLPLFKDEREAQFGAYLATLETGIVAGARWPAAQYKDTALSGSAIVAYRLSKPAGDAATVIASALQSFWSVR